MLPDRYCDCHFTLCSEVADPSHAGPFTPARRAVQNSPGIVTTVGAAVMLLHNVLYGAGHT